MFSQPMDFLHYLADFGAALFLCNCLPHLLCGLRGEPFPTPFAKPPGIGHSSPLTNFLWGTFNLVIGAALLCYSPFQPGLNWVSLVFLAGFVAFGSQTSRHFGSVRQNDRGQP